MELRAAAERISRAHEAHSDSLSLSGAFIVHLEDLPAELTALTHLTRLDLSYNVLATLPDSLGELRSLTHLSAAHNSLSALPAALSTLSRLTFLNFSFNRISSIPDVLFSSLTALRTLDLQRNRLAALPPAVGALVHLEGLNVASNGLERLPGELGRCTALTQLAISGNALRTLPTELSSLSRLERLYAAQNKLALLPDAALGALRALVELDLRDNQLALLPASLTALTALKKLVLAGNERLPIPSTVPLDDVPALIGAIRAVTDKDRSALVVAAASRVFPEVETRKIAQMAAQYSLSTDDLLRNLSAYVATLPPPAPPTAPTGVERLIANYSPPPPAAEEPRRGRRGTLTAVDQEDLARNRLVSALQTETHLQPLLSHALAARAFLAAPPAISVHLLDITRSVMENHLLIPVPGSAALFSTLAGVEGRFVTNQKGQRFIHLFRARKRHDELHDPLLNPAEEFEEEEVCQAESITAESKLVFDAATKGDVANHMLTILHISAPLLINGQAWQALRSPPLPTDWVSFVTASYQARLELAAGKDIKASIDQFVKDFTRRPPPEEAQGEVVRSFLAELAAQLDKHTYWSRLDPFERKADFRTAESVLFTRLASALVPTAADAERDKVIARQLRRLAWLEARHLDINPRFHNEELWDKAMRELRTVSSLPSPDEKLAAVLNACKILIFLLTSAGSPAGADDFLPHLIYVTIKAAPPRLSWNLRFIERFCDPEVLSMENLCFFTHLIFTVSFVESLAPASLSIDAAEFARRVKQADAEMEKEESGRRMRSLFGGGTGERDG